MGLLTRLGLIVTLLEQGYALFSSLSIGFATGKIAIILTRNFFNNSKLAKTGSIVGKISFKNLSLAYNLDFAHISNFSISWSVAWNHTYSDNDFINRIKS